MTPTAGIPSALSLSRGEVRRASAHRRETGGLVGQLALAVLVGFHAYLFWARLLDGGFFEPAVAARWLSGALLTVGFAVLRRTGLSLVWGRKAVVLWLLVGLLHVHAAITPRVGASLGTGPQEVAAFVLQAASATTLLAVGFVLLALLVRQPLGRPHPSSWFAAHDASVKPARDGVSLLLSPRPPPVPAIA